MSAIDMILGAAPHAIGTTALGVASAGRLTAPLAQTPAGSGTGSLISLLMMAAVFVIFYVLLILPARRKQKAHEEMLKKVTTGDSVVTQGGIIGKVVKADDTTLRVRIATGVEVSVLRGYVAGKAPEEVS